MFQMSKQAWSSEDEHCLTVLRTRKTKDKDSLRNTKGHRADTKSLRDKLEGHSHQSGWRTAATHWLLPDLSFFKFS